MDLQQKLVQLYRMITPQPGGARVAQVSTQASAAAPSSAIASCSAPPGQVGAGVLSFLDHDSVSSRSVDSSTQAQAPPPNREEADYGTYAGPVQVLAPQVSAQGQAPPPEELETGQAQALAKAAQAKGDTKAPHGGYRPNSCTGFDRSPPDLQYFPLRRYSSSSDETPPAPAFDEMD